MKPSEQWEEEFDKLSREFYADFPVDNLYWNRVVAPLLRKFRELLSQAKAEVREEVMIKINCEIGCIQSGNALSPNEQQIALTVCENIKERLKNF